jgi:UDP-N-acetylmuramoyl-L-alanyl-D-glutamate--2,6-diaminopimelate ligase
MTLVELISAAQTLSPGAREQIGSDRAGAVVTNVAHDSRAATAGSVFVAIPGHRADGTEFAGQAVERGALAVVSEAPAPPGIRVPWLRTTNARLALAELAAIVHANPSERLTVVGVTGTNGKTTVTYLLSAVLDAAQMTCGRMGTVSVKLGPRSSDEQDAAHTTPEASEVQRLLAEMLARGCKACAMEVSSHALALHRVAFVRFSAGIFTNLTRDHLDFHVDMQQYFEAKRRLFEMLPAGAPAIVNVDDPRGLELSRTRSNVVTYAIDRQADVQPGPVHASLDGLEFEARTPKGPVMVRSPLVGRPNVYNILATVAAAVALGVAIPAIETGLTRLRQVPGRFEMVSGPGDDVRAVVDYAHTDDALKNLLETARGLAKGRIVTVFGCGGDRDRTKRPLMGAVAARLSDLVVLTSDNPRSEDPERIIEEITRGLAPSVDPGAPPRPVTPFVTYLDRRAAIEHAIREASPGDVVLIAGKGHEKYQVIGTRTMPFDDVDVARAALAQRRAASKV